MSRCVVFVCVNASGSCSRSSNAWRQRPMLPSLASHMRMRECRLYVMLYVPSDVDQMLEQCCANAVCKHRPSLNMMHRDSLLRHFSLSRNWSPRLCTLGCGIWVSGSAVTGVRTGVRLRPALAVGAALRAARPRRSPHGTRATRWGGTATGQPTTHLIAT